ncbi:SLATT domain-containing protein [Thioclava sp. GXIMD4216]|uniref:SLATT domain-containing protein n=1 Tax=Thioclava sp. GXIMD4216 TaxID=3131929 RepID=UPI0030D26E2A
MNSNEVDEFYRKKVASIRKTAYIRFDVAERLQAINYISLVASLILTTYLSAWAIFTVFFPNVLSSRESEFVSYIAVMATISLMLLTVLDYVADRSVKAQTFLRCGNALLQVADELEHAILSKEHASQLKIIVGKYHSILNESSLNHTSEDNDLYDQKSNLRKAGCFSRYPMRLFFIWSVVLYYAKRISLQIIVAIMVIAPTVAIIKNLTLF